jgi:tetratricopeptide (TPR) repeat protein
MWEKARDLAAELARRPDAEPDYEYDLGLCLGNLGWLKAERGDHGGARRLLEEAVGHLLTALRSGPQRLDYRKALRNQYQVLAETLVRLGDRERAVEAAESLAAVFPDRALGHYYAACFVARCVPLAEDAGRDDDAARHAERAAALLGQALDKGLTGGERLSGADEKKHFGPLAERPGFGELLKQLEARARPGGAKSAR